MRILSAAVGHETNTFCPPTQYSSFMVTRRSSGATIDQMMVAPRPTNPVIAAAIEATEAEIVHVYSAVCMPSGPITAEALERLESELIDEITRELPADALLLMMHGAAVAENSDDVESHVLRRLREAVGRDMPIAAYFDLHGNATQEMADLLDITLPCHEYPHIDFGERAAEAIHLLHRMKEDGLRPVTHVERLPILLQPNDTFEGYMKVVNEKAAEIERRPGVIECGVFHGFPYCDVPINGVHIISTTDGDLELARRNGRELGEFIWESREKLLRECLTPEQAIAQALAVDAGGPVVVNDTADNPGGGSPGDATHVLRALIDAGIDNVCFAWMADPETVRQAITAGPGATIRVRLGGKTDTFHGEPIEAEAYVQAFTDGRLPQGSFMLEGNIGPTARLRIGMVDVVVASKPGQVTHPSVFQIHGIDPKHYRIVALKGSNHFRAGFQDMAAAIVTADSPGLTSLRLETFERHRAPRPIWPLDDAASYPAEAEPADAAASGLRA